MARHPYQNDLSFLERHYSGLLLKYGDTTQSAQQRDRETQERRMRILTEVGDIRSSKILDFGCGTGHLLSFLRHQLGFEGEYVGYDLSQEMILVAREKFPGVRFEQRDILAEGLPEDFDHILISGVFSNLVSDNWGLMTSILRCLFRSTRKALSFNALSTYVDYFEPDLFYVSPQRVLRFCKEQLSVCVTLRHDYFIKEGIIPYEFTVYVYKTGIELRQELST